MQHKPLLIKICLIFSAIVWGSTFFVIKNTLDEVNALTLTSYRFLLAAAILGISLVFLRKKLFTNFKAGFLLGLLLLAFYLCQTTGLHFTTASNSGFISCLFVVFTPLFAWVFWRTRTNPAHILAVALTFIGLWLITGEIHEFNIGDLLSLLAAFIGSLHILFVDKYMKSDFDPFILSFQQFLVIGILSFILARLLHFPLTLPTAGTLYSIIYLAVFASIIGYVAQFIAQKYASPTAISVILTLEPVFAAIFAWTLGGEAFHTLKATGGALIFFATLVAIPSEQKILDLLNKLRKRSKVIWQ